MSLIVYRKKVKLVADIMQGNFLTKSKGDDSELVWVRYNNGSSKPMRHAKKRCLDEAGKWRRSLHRAPSREEWRKNPRMPTLETVDELFGSFDKMLEQLERRHQPPPPRPKVIKTSRTKPQQLATQEYTSDTEESEKDMRRRAQKWTDLALAKALHDACVDHGGQAIITKTQYSTWRSGSDDEENLPTDWTIAQRLGGGTWVQAFPKMRELLTYEPTRLVIEPEKPEEPEGSEEFGPKQPEPESEEEPELEPGNAEAEADQATISCCRLVNMVGHDFDLGDLHFKTATSDCFAVVVERQTTLFCCRTKHGSRISEKTAEKSYELKMARGSLRHLVDFPEFSSDVLYLVDSDLYAKLPVEQRRADLIPVYQDSRRAIEGLFVK